MNLLDVDQKTWDEFNALLDQALDLPESERAKWLDSLGPEHSALKERLGVLLQHATPTSDLPFARPLALQPGAEGDQVGPYRLIQSIGEGGMGTVWLAKRSDGLLKRPVALKLPWERLEGDLLHRRFEREREILASLDHPNIAKVYDAGLSEKGQPYLALEYIEGVPLDQYAKDNALGLQARLELFLQIVDAVAYAHSKLIIHRDLKPANILVTQEGQVRLLDFGIAKLLENGAAKETELTARYGRALTLSYASPEQIEGQPLGVGTDIYSLGVLLYELLCETSPYRLSQVSRRALEEAILHQSSLKPSAVMPSRRAALTGDLDTIALKALKKTPLERYRTAQAFGDDIERHLTGHPVLARPDSRLYRFKKFVRRHRLGAGLGLLASLAIMSATGAAIWQAQVAIVERQRAEAEAQRAKEVKTFLTSLFKRANPFVNQQGTQSIDQLLISSKDKIDAQFGDRPKLRAELLGIVATALSEIGQPKPALPILKEALRATASALGPDSEAVLKLRIRMTTTEILLGNFQRANAELNALLAIFRRDPQKHKRRIALVLTNAANLSTQLGHWAQARVFADEFFTLSASLYGTQSHGHHVAHIIRAKVALFAASPKEGLAIAQKALDFGESLYSGPKVHPQTLDASSLFAVALSRSGKTKAAIERSEGLVVQCGEILGPNHPLTRSVWVHLSDVYARTGATKKALAAATRALEIVEASKLNDLKRGEALLARGIALDALGEDARARTETSSAALLLERTLAKNDIRVDRARAYHALSLARLQHQREAEALLAKLGEGRRAPDAFDEIAYLQGEIERLLGRESAAIKAQTKAMASLERAPNARFWRPRVEIALGQATVHQNPAKARQLLESGLRSARFGLGSMREKRDAENKLKALAKQR